MAKEKSQKKCCVKWDYKIIVNMFIKRKLGIK